MISNKEKIQIQYEISMAIGTSLDLNKMLHYSLSVVLRKLNCPVGGIDFIIPDGSEVFTFKPVIGIPRKADAIATIEKAMAFFPATFTLEKLDEYLSKLPTTVDCGNEGLVHLFEIPDVGVLYLLSKGNYIDGETIRSMSPLMEKLSIAIKTCKQNDELIRHKKNLAELVNEQTNELVAQKKELELKNTELTELNATKNKFFSIIAHDLRTPFSGIIGLTNLILDNIQEFSHQELHSYIGELNKEAKTSFKLLENLLEWSRMQSGRIEYNPEYFDLNEVIKLVTGLLEKQAAQKEIKLVENCSSRKLLIKADRQMLATVLRNLVSNAIKFTNRSGSVTLSVYIKGDFAVMEVKDTGIGMEQDQLAKLFKVENTFSTHGTENEKGTGLGLILCKEFVDLHQGAIDVKSELDKGTCIKVSLPM